MGALTHTEPGSSRWAGAAVMSSIRTKGRTEAIVASGDRTARRKPGLSEQMCEHYSRQINTIILPVIGSLRMSEVTTDSIADVMATRAHLGRSSQRDTVQTLKQIFSAAADADVIRKDPTRTLKPGGKKPPQKKALTKRQEEELRAGQSLCGIHREDVELLLDDQPAKVFASQGQQRSVVLSLKMAEAAAAAQITGEHPVLLLDDVLSELDEGRKQYLLTCMKEKQTFVTSCDDTAFLKTDGEVYRMNGGVLSRA